MKFYGGVLSSTRKDWLNFGGDLGILRSVNEQEKKCVNYFNAIVTICWLLEPQMLLHQMYTCIYVLFLLKARYSMI